MRRPAAVSKAEIDDRIRPEASVSDVNRATLVFEIRTAFGDEPMPLRHGACIGLGSVAMGPRLRAGRDGRA